MSKRTNKRQAEVVDLVRKALPDDPSFAEELNEQINRRQLVTQLSILRNCKGISQADIAEQLECSQSRVSKLENGYDENVTIAEMAAYARLSDHDVTILFTSRGDTLAAQVKYHAMCIKDCFDRMNELVQGDSTIAKGVAGFHLEALLNLVKIVGDASHGLRSAVVKHSITPMISVQVSEMGCDHPDIAKIPPCPFGEHVATS